MKAPHPETYWSHRRTPDHAGGLRGRCPVSRPHPNQYKVSELWTLEEIREDVVAWTRHASDELDAVEHFQCCNCGAIVSWDDGGDGEGGGLCSSCWCRMDRRWRFDFSEEQVAWILSWQSGAER